MSDIQHFSSDDTCSLSSATQVDDFQDGQELKRKFQDSILETNNGNQQENKVPVTPQRKKPGRKPNPAAPALRKEQNRAAQRAFRERKERHVRELENMVKEMRQIIHDNACKYEFDTMCLRQSLSSLEQENQFLKQHLMKLDSNAELIIKEANQHAQNLNKNTFHPSPPMMSPFVGSNGIRGSWGNVTPTVPSTPFHPTQGLAITTTFSDPTKYHAQLPSPPSSLCSPQFIETSVSSTPSSKEIPMTPGLELDMDLLSQQNDSSHLSMTFSNDQFMESLMNASSRSTIHDYSINAVDYQEYDQTIAPPSLSKNMLHAPCHMGC